VFELKEGQMGLIMEVGRKRGRLNRKRGGCVEFQLNNIFQWCHYKRACNVTTTRPRRDGDVEQNTSERNRTGIRKSLK
jgi:hypothetical protein